MKTQFVTALIIALFLSGCGGSDPLVKPVRTSGSKPSWVSDSKTYWVKDARMHFVVLVNNEPDLTFGITGLDGRAYVTLINLVKVRASTEFDEATKGSKFSTESIGQARQSVVNAAGDVKFSDLAKSEQYWEQFSTKEDYSARTKTTYDIYGVYSISEQEFSRAKEEAWNKASTERKADREAKELLDDAKKRFIQKEQ